MKKNNESIFSLTENLSRISQEINKKIDRLTFNEKYAYKGIPVIFKNAFKEWPIREIWSIEYLLSKCGDHSETLYRNIAGKTEKKTFKFSEYLEYLKISEFSPYYFVSQMHLFNSDLWKDYKSPDIFNCWYKNSKIHKQKTFLSWIYLGPNNSCTPLHKDVWCTSAWNYLIMGQKVWFFFPPSLNEIIEKYKDDELGVFKILNEEKDIKPLFIIQNEGELVYTPSNWYHCVFNTETSLSLTENFFNQTNYEYVLSSIKNNRSDEDYKILTKIINEGFTKLKLYEN